MEERLRPGAIASTSTFTWMSAGRTASSARSNAGPNSAVRATVSASAPKLRASARNRD